MAFPTLNAEQIGVHGRGKKVILIVMDKIAFRDLKEANTPNIDFMMEGGGAALMNTRTAGSKNTQNSYASIGAGKHMITSASAGEAFNSSSVIEQIPVKEQYFARTGKAAPLGGVVLEPRH